MTITETFAEGSLIDKRVRTVVTNATGKYRSLLPGGPSRDVQVEFAGSRKYLDDQAGGLDFDVRGAATFATSKRRVKAGSSVSFIGRVKRYYAQIPKGGKLVEVQVKSGDDWITLKEAIGTDATGPGRDRSSLSALLHPAGDLHIPTQGHSRERMAVSRCDHYTATQGDRDAAMNSTRTAGRVRLGGR